MRRARLGNYRLTGAVLYVTIEPCLMCVGALVHARIHTLVYGAAEPRTGAVLSTVRGGELPGHNHRFEVVAGIAEAECRELMQTVLQGPALTYGAAGSSASTIVTTIRPSANAPTMVTANSAGRERSRRALANHVVTLAPTDSGDTVCRLCSDGAADSLSERN